MKPHRRNLLRMLAASAVMPWAAFGAERPVRIVSPFPPGGSADSTARALAERLTQRMGNAFYIENHPGAGGNIAADITARAKPDGSTIIIGTAGAMAINKTLYKSLPYDPVLDFAPISLVGFSPVLLVAAPSAPAKTVEELIAAAKAAPGQITYASVGVGTAHHLAAELFQQMAGVKMNHIPYNGGAASAQDVIAGRVPYGFLDLTRCLPLVRAGRMHGIATTGLRRSEAAPEIPTVAESGLAGFDANGWFGLFAPAHTPASFIEAMNAQVRQVLAEPAFRSTAIGLAVDIQGSTPKELQDYQVQEIEKWAKIIRTANVSIDP